MNAVVNAGDIAVPVKGGTVLQTAKDLSFSEKITNVASYQVASFTDQIPNKVLFAYIIFTATDGNQTVRRVDVWSADIYDAHPDYTHQDVYDAISVLLGI